MAAELEVGRFLDGVRTYYDKNTPRFARSHESAAARAIHREVWGPGVPTERAAFEYVNTLVQSVIESLSATFPAPMRVLDLGCGVGGTLLYLAARVPLQGVGVTLSPVGVRLAEANTRDAGLGGVCRFVEANYLELPALESQHAIYAIESFLHGPDAERFFQTAAAVLAPGGRLIVCDDFLTEKGERSMSRKDTRNLADFKQGWHVGTLITTERTRALAANAGLQTIEDQDLTPYLRLRRPVDRRIAAFVTLGRFLPFRSPWWDSWVGGHAIQQCLLAGLIGYRFMTFGKPA